MIGLAAACGYDTLPSSPRRAGRAGGLRRRAAHRRPARATGGSATRWARSCRAGCAGSARTWWPGFDPLGPVEDTLDAHVDGDAPPRWSTPTWSAPPAAPCTARSTTCTRRWPSSAPATSPTRSPYGPASRCCSPRCRRPGGRPGARPSPGLPGNPQSAIVALVSLVVPLLAGPGRPARARRGHVTLGERDPRPRRPHPPGAGPRGRPVVSPIRSPTPARPCCAGWPGPTGSPSSRPAPRARRHRRYRSSPSAAARERP